MLKKIVIGITVLFLASPVFASSNYWWENEDEGWFWYNDPEPEVYSEPEPEEEPEIASPFKALPLTEEPLASERMKRYGDQLLSEAIVNPTPAKVREYVEYQKYMMTMAQEFSEAWQVALMQNPELGASTAVKSDMLKAIRNLSDRAGILYFYEADCEGCDYMTKELKDFLMTYPEMSIIPISLDGYVSSDWPGTREDNGISEQIGITKTPSLFLAFPRENRFKKVTDYAISSVELEKRIFYYTRDGQKQMEEYRKLVFTKLGIAEER